MTLDRGCEQPLNGSTKELYIISPLPFLRRKTIFTRLLKWTIWFLIGLLCCTQIGVAVLQIWLSNSSTQYDIVEPHFHFYKNTLFPEIAQNLTITPNCTALLAYPPLKNTPGMEAFGLRYIDGENLPVLSPDTQSPWQMTFACLRGFKVVPSTPLASAYTPTFLTVLTWFNMVTISTLFSLKSLIFESHTPKDCTGIRWWEYALKGYTTISFLFWWYSTGALAFSRPHHSPVSPLAWISTWRDVVSLHRHPFLCRFYQHTRKRKALLMFLYTVTAIQWAASCWAFWQLTSWHFQKYSCLHEEVDSAPGVSQCSASELCGKKALFFEPSHVLLAFVLPPFIYCSIAAWHPAISFFSDLFDGNFPGPWDGSSDPMELFPSGRPIRCWSWDVMDALFRFGAETLLVPLCLVLSVLFFLRPVPNPMSDMGTIVVDLPCHAIHIGLSPSKYFYDVGSSAKVLRIVRDWFSA